MVPKFGYYGRKAGWYLNFNTIVEREGGTQISIPRSRRRLVHKFECQPLKGSDTQISIPCSWGGTVVKFQYHPIERVVLKFQCHLLEGDGIDISIPTYRAEVVLKFQCRDIEGKWYWSLSTNLSRDGSTQISMPTFRRGSYSKLSTMISKQGVTFEYYAIERGGTHISIPR